MSIEVNWGNIPKAPPLNEILLLEEVSEMTRLPRATLRFYRHRGQGGLKSFRLGNRVVYKRTDVEAWIESRYNDDNAGQRAG
jgi:predicted DNA-binding transcriptional regulator AlpA